jgi:uncharacterized DUF497 family protein
VPYQFEWDADKAAANLRKHGVSFDEVVTAFSDRLSILLPDPDHSVGEEHYLVMGLSARGRLLVLPLSSARHEPESSLQDSLPDASAMTMKKAKGKQQVRGADRDTMRPEYDFSKGARGVTAARYREGTNIIVLDPELMDVFPDSEAVNEALRALAPVLRRRKRVS